MSWIQENKFTAMLGGATLVGAGVLFALGMSFRSKYGTAMEEHTTASGEVAEFEGVVPYPNDANKAAKAKALKDYREQVGGLQKAFDKFRPKEIKNASPQGFTDQAKAATDEVTAAFTKAGTKLPDGFFLGFEAYSGPLPKEGATGLLNFQLLAVKDLMLDLAKAAPSQLINVHRPKFPEEEDKQWEPGATDAARAFPLEITFKGTEKSAREFISALAKSPTHFYTVRSMRLKNEKDKAPSTTDSKFETTTPGGRAAANPFPGGGFVLPSDEPVAPAGGAAPGAAAAAPAAPAAAKPAETGRVLNQVLGSEELQVFLRIDVLQFLPIKPIAEVPQ